MKRGQFTEEQIIGILHEVEAGQKIADLCRKYGVSQSNARPYIRVRFSLSAEWLPVVRNAVSSSVFLIEMIRFCMRITYEYRQCQPCTGF